ncbi:MULTISPECIES: type II secretion system protein [Pontibacillus]|uniref:Type II secretion system protein n=1 Tax=Pontibacillus chungwhensis TaxID=265426 RepID=A0ABY8UWE4_9BACI|nr:MULTISPECIES: type II secretion system protein [Pontibacillus]MCD5324121.1 type II secretion system GspH family protein [Pontibacillus sp. HN14]WIF97822.1 type II secretion system protein [Pontibacillus chungwhensis]
MKYRFIFIHKIKYGNQGFTLVELLAVITILGFLSAIAVVSVRGIIDRSEAAACQSNRNHLEREYHRHLIMEELDHSDELFVMYQDGYGEICLVGGEVGSFS